MLYPGSRKTLLRSLRFGAERDWRPAGGDREDDTVDNENETVSSLAWRKKTVLTLYMAPSESCVARPTTLCLAPGSVQRAWCLGETRGGLGENPEREGSIRFTSGEVSTNS